MDISVVPYGNLSEDSRDTADHAIDRIFFEASSVQSFTDDAHRKAFRHLWLGQYLEHEPEEAFVALQSDEVCGYLVGSLIDPAPRPEFGELDYFVRFALFTARFPAHLHINVDSSARSQGIGARLIAEFEQHAKGHGCPGLHIVTGAGLRNVDFYERLGFSEVARAPRKGAEVVMLAKPL